MPNCKNVRPAKRKSRGAFAGTADSAEPPLLNSVVTRADGFKMEKKNPQINSKGLCDVYFALSSVFRQKKRKKTFSKALLLKQTSSQLQLLAWVTGLRLVLLIILLDFSKIHADFIARLDVSSPMRQFPISWVVTIRWNFNCLYNYHLALAGDTELFPHFYEF